MGKSTVAEYLSRKGESVVDTDVLARELVAPGQPALTEISHSFGHNVLAADGSLDRPALAKIVFQDASHRKTLETILHPRIRAAWKSWAGRCFEQGARRVVVVIPLLFETGADRELNLTLCVACSPETQTRRLHTRGWNDQEIERRISAQLPVREKIERSSRVVWNEAGLDVCEKQVARIFASL
jgi:dephospho-CoA kinase